MAEKKKWFMRGEAGWNRSKKMEEESQKRREGSQGPRRLWMPKDSAAKVTFLDTPSFFVLEHTLPRISNTGKKYYIQETCISDVDTCPVCESGDISSLVVVGTIINHKEWEDNAGNKHVNEKELFVGKRKARQRIQDQIGYRDGDLTYATYDVKRGSSQNEEATGEGFEFLKKLKKEQLKGFVPKGEDQEEWLKPYDYEELFKPKSAEELRKIAGGEVPVGSAEEEGEKEGDNGEKDAKDAPTATSIDELL